MRRQQRCPAQHGVVIIVHEQRLPSRLDDLADAVPVAQPVGLPHGRVVVSVFQIPRSSPQRQRARAVVGQPLQARQKRLAEQGMIAVPTIAINASHALDKQPSIDDGVQIRPHLSGGKIGQRSGQGIHRARGHHEVEQLGGKGIEHFLEQVFLYALLCPGQRRGHIESVAAGAAQPHQTAGGRPSLGCIVQMAGVLGRKFNSLGSKQRRLLIRSQTQIRLGHLSQLARRAQLRQGQTQRHSRRHDHMHVGWQMAHEKAQALGHERRVLNLVNVLEHQGRQFAPVGECQHEQRDGAVSLGAVRPSDIERVEGRTAQHTDAFQRREYQRPEAGRLSVILVQRAPGNRVFRSGGPGGAGRGLAEAGRGHHGGKRALPSPGEASLRPRPHDRERVRSRRAHLRRQKHEAALATGDAFLHPHGSPFTQ